MIDHNKLIWTDNFTFVIETGAEVLQVEVIEAEVESVPVHGKPDDEVIKEIKKRLGKASVKVQDFQSQAKDRKDIELENGSGRVNMTFLWIWNM
jgi:uncharacterized protein YggU (UPF0235/DUF167 family)